LPVAVISDKDRAWKLLDEQEQQLKSRMNVNQAEPVGGGLGKS